MPLRHRTLAFAFAILILGHAPSIDAQSLKTAAKVANAPLPLARHPQGQQMMSAAAQKAALLDIKFQFLNKTYENDVYAKDPFGNKYRVSCVRFRATSGFGFTVDPPAISLTTAGLRLEQNIAKLTGDGLTVKIQLGACTDITAGVGVRLSNVKVTYTAKPMFTIDESQRCRVTWSHEDDDLKVAIGDLNITGVQNDIDRLAKDAVREAINAALDAYFSGRIRGELLKASVDVCGGGKR